MIQLLTYLLIVVVIILLIILLVYFINFSTNDYEKYSSYECGFEPFSDARSFFDVHFYTIGLLFIIFDLEIVFLIPIIVDISNLSFLGYINLLIFLIIILIGFYYEWSIGLLNWVPTKLKTNIFWLFYSINTVYFINFDFILLIILISLLLLLNQLNNLIYRVINLANLSLVVIGTWIYCSDLIFLYIVYILAFIGAVIMLFLSIILMLPATITLNNKNNIIGFFLTTELFLNNSYAQVLWFLIVTLIISQFLNLLILMLDFNVVELYQLIKSIIIYLIYHFRGIKNLKDFNITIIKFSLKIYNNIKNILGIGVPPSIYGAYTKNFINISAIPKLAPIGMYLQNILYYIYIHIEIHLYGEISPNMYKELNPVWNNLFKLFEYKYVPSSSILRQHWPLPDFNMEHRYVPINFNYSIFQLFPYLIKVPFINYIRKNGLLFKIINRCLFIINLFNFFILNSINNIYIFFFKFIKKYILLITQVIVIVNVYIFAIPPFNCDNIILHNTFKNINLLNMDSLLAIKYIFYEQHFLFIILSVIGLLISLIGSAIFTRNK